MARTRNRDFDCSAVSPARGVCTAHQNGSPLTRPEPSPWLAVLFLALVSLHAERAVSQPAPTEPTADKLPSVVYPVRDPNTVSHDNGPRVFTPQLPELAEAAAPVQFNPTDDDWDYGGYWGRDRQFHFGRPTAIAHVATGRHSLPVTRVQYRTSGARR